MSRAKTILRKTLRWMLWTFIALIALLVLFIYTLRIPSVQNKLTQRTITYLKSRLKTEVRLKSIYIAFPKKIVLQGLYLEDQSKDTLLYSGDLRVDTDLWNLLDRQIELNSVEAETLSLRITRGAQDSTFNFDYIIAAFSDTTTASSPADTARSDAWTFSLEDVALQNASIDYVDEFAGRDVQVDLGQFVLSMKTFDPVGAVYSVNSLKIQNAQAALTLNSSQEPKLTTPDTLYSPSPAVTFKDLDLSDVAVRYADHQTQQSIQTEIKKLVVEAEEFNLQKKIIHLDNILLKNSSLGYQQGPTAAHSKDTDQAPTPSMGFEGINVPYDVQIKQATLINNKLQYDNSNFLATHSIDPNHVQIFDLNLSANALTARGNSIAGKIKECFFSEQSGLSLRSLETLFALAGNQLTVENLDLASGSSRIRLKGRNKIPLTTHEGSLDIAMESRIAVQDVLFFFPHLMDSIPLQLHDNSIVMFETDLRGTLQDLSISKLTVASHETDLALRGKVKGLPETKNIVLDVDVKHFKTTASDLRAILPDSLIPSAIELPEWIDLSGKYSGSLHHSSLQALLSSSFGNVSASGKLDFTSLPAYDVAISTDQYQVGKLLKQSGTMGELSAEATAKGKGISIDSIQAALNILVHKFQYDHYTYSNFKLDGTLTHALFSGTASLHDENLDFTIKGGFDYTQAIPLYKFTCELTNANFQKLNLTEQPFKARGTLDINLSTSDFKIMNGTMAIRKVALYNGETLYTIDSLLFASLDQEGESKMTLQSDILSGEFTGTFNLFTLPRVMRQHINQYFSLQQEDVKDFESPQRFKFNLTLKNTDFITEILLPDLEPFIPGVIQGEFDSEENRLEIAGTVARVKYATTEFDSLSLHVSSDEEALRYNLRLKNLTLDTMTVDVAQLTGKIEHDSILTSFQILNAKGEKKYVLGGVLESQQNNFRFHFLPDQVMLNYTPWEVPPNNFLEFSKAGLVARDFSIHHESERVALITTIKDSTVSLEFNQLQLSSLTRVVRGVMPANGILNGNLKFTTAALGTFNSQLTIDDLEILEKRFGTLSLKLGHTSNRYLVNLLLKDTTSLVKADGTITSDGQTSSVDLTTTFSPINLRIVEALSLGQLKNVKGLAEGQLKLSGPLLQPAIHGNMKFNDVTFLSTYLNSTFMLTDETISFGESGIALHNFTLLDDQKNKAVLNGDILTKDYRNFRFNLTATATNFRILHTTSDDNDLYYGTVGTNAHATITGNANRPRVDMNVSFSDDTDLTYVVPQEQKTVIEQKGIVQFVDKNAEHDPFLIDLQSLDTITSRFTGINLSANLELTDKATLNIIIDPISGDKLTVQGTSDLTFDIDASGDMNLTGRYEISNGSYELSFYKLIKRKFDIDKGGTMVWSGNPFNAQLDIRARYKVETSPLDLVYNQINTSDQSQINTYRQRLPFLVYLDIDGQLLSPQIRFQLDMPTDKQSAFGGVIYAKITDINTRESDVNKQVFALLILKRFVSDNPFDSQAGSDIANTTRTSVSRILSDQLNRLSENVKGIQLSFDIKSYEDYSTGRAQGDTQVQLGVSKSFLGDRLVVKLSGNVDVEGETSQQESLTDYIGDLALEYKITEDGRFRVTGFRTSNYDLIDGELTETGAGLLYIKDYNTLQELFKSNGKAK